MMPVEQFERLPKLFQEIVLLDREIRAMRIAPVTKFKDWCGKRARQRELRITASKRYGKVGSDGSAARA